jgi:phosphoribosylformylglycinamidine synthase
MMKPKALVLRAPGVNCDEETARAWELAGAEVESRHVERLVDDRRALDRFQILTLPGGFSYGDDLGAGKILAAKLGVTLADSIARLRDRGGLILGICNGFQTLVKAGLLPGGTHAKQATLTHNDSRRYEARWTRLVVSSRRCVFLASDDPLELPVAHGEGKFVVADSAALDELFQGDQVVLRYADSENRPTELYPANPNGSARGVAAVCDPTGRVFGLMPHPERHVERFHHPRWTRLERRTDGVPDGLRIFQNAVAALK